MSGTGIYAPPTPPGVPADSTFAGMTTAQLQTALTSAQTALIQLVTGGKPVVVSYAQGIGTKSVTFTRASEGALRHLIAELNVLLGQGSRRRAIGVRF